MAGKYDIEGKEYLYRYRMTEKFGGANGNSTSTPNEPPIEPPSDPLHEAANEPPGIPANFPATGPPGNSTQYENPFAGQYYIPSESMLGGRGGGGGGDNCSLNYSLFNVGQDGSEPIQCSGASLHG